MGEKIWSKNSSKDNFQVALHWPARSWPELTYSTRWQKHLGFILNIFHLKYFLFPQKISLIESFSPSPKSVTTIAINEKEKDVANYMFKVLFKVSILMGSWMPWSRCPGLRNIRYSPSPGHGYHFLENLEYVQRVASHQVGSCPRVARALSRPPGLMPGCLFSLLGACLGCWRWHSPSSGAWFSPERKRRLHVLCMVYIL